ncbi:Alpha/beta hydrolase family protein [Corynebacterium kalinowskii]|uniref:Alpha/beta hydrolase family protein n=1 Tax=Corynebacterium kalinowskii TaxID=2675216 RepID=A0A6B8V867_9CORY|nr:Alpha/beta hydrolase family protein [Corynebacterium kalinowskii]
MMLPRRSRLLWLPRRGRLPVPIESDGVPVVVLHGTLGSPGNFERLAQELAARGRRVVGFEYGDRGTGDLEASTAEVTEFLGQFELVDVIAHSLGGLMALRASHHHGGGKIRILIGLGASWRGLPERWYKNLLGNIAGPAFAQLMQRFEASVPEGTTVISIISDADTVVPRSSSTLGEVIEVHGVHHAHIPNQTDVIISALERAVAGTR